MATIPESLAAIRESLEKTKTGLGIFVPLGAKPLLAALDSNIEALRMLEERVKTETRDVAERQREACAAHIETLVMNRNAPGFAEMCREAPLVTETSHD